MGRILARLRRTAMVAVHAVVLAALVALAAPDPAAAQWPPDALTNLQVLPEDIPFQRLMGTMAGFTRALGIRCSTCHVGEEGQPLAAYDFAADDKAMKRKAREMLRMVGALNTEHLAGLEDRSEPAVEVQCFTCHRGSRIPRTLQQELRIAYDDGGLDALVARYHALRDRWYGRAAYDFGTVPLADIGQELQGRGALADAEAVHALNVEMNAGEWFPQFRHAPVAIANAFMESPTAGEARYAELKTAYDPRATAEPLMNQVAYSLLPRDPEAAVALFRLIADEHPDSWNAFDSLGEGLERTGDVEGAAAAYRRSLELNPENRNARDRLEEIGG